MASITWYHTFAALAGERSHGTSPRHYCTLHRYVKVGNALQCIQCHGVRHLTIPVLPVAVAERTQHESTPIHARTHPVIISDDYPVHQDDADEENGGARISPLVSGDRPATAQAKPFGASAFASEIENSPYLCSRPVPLGDRPCPDMQTSLASPARQPVPLECSHDEQGTCTDTRPPEAQAACTSEREEEDHQVPVVLKTHSADISIIEPNPAVPDCPLQQAGQCSRPEEFQDPIQSGPNQRGTVPAAGSCTVPAAREIAIIDGQSSLEATTAGRPEDVTSEQPEAHHSQVHDPARVGDLLAARKEPSSRGPMGLLPSDDKEHPPQAVQEIPPPAPLFTKPGCPSLADSDSESSVPSLCLEDLLSQMNRCVSCLQDGWIQSALRTLCVAAQIHTCILTSLTCHVWGSQGL